MCGNDGIQRTRDVFRIEPAAWCAEPEEFIRATVAELHRDGIDDCADIMPFMDIYRSHSLQWT